MPRTSSGEDEPNDASTIDTEKKFMQILRDFADSSLEDKRFLVVNCDNVFSAQDESDWMLSMLDNLADLLEKVDSNATYSRHKLPDVPSDVNIGRTPWTFTPHTAQYITYLMFRMLGSKAVDIRSRNLIHKVIVRQFRNASCTQVKAALLRFSKCFVRFLTPAEVKDFILPLIPLCLNSRNLEKLAAAMEAIPKLVEYPISTETYENCLNKAINAFKKSASRPQIQSVAIQCVANIIPYLPRNVVENVLLPFALEATAEAANNAGTVRVRGGSEEVHGGSAALDESCLIPCYLIEFDFFLSKGEPVISLCCLLKTLLRERRSILSPSMIAMEILPCLLPHTLNKQWQFNEFKYIMSTIYEYLDFLNEANPPPSSQDNFQSPSRKETTRNGDQEIKLKGPASEGNNTDSRFTLEDNSNISHLITPSTSSNKDGQILLTPQSTSSSNISNDKAKSSSQNILNTSNLLTVSVCEGPFNLSNNSRRRSAIDLRSSMEIFPPMQSQPQQLTPAQVFSNSPKKSPVIN
ncbi:hypothetical protein Aperf_G00000045699 [Anoplocephala perfoliata]